ncbi:transcript variant X1 [Nothobranchius furzeri]|uniref:Transcript variant X1 n=1 Tax=Nothobranchius furzeri TaxID=105023 RepID=A0A9D2Z1M4_NOTFU|nr:transcript variant X1 [Nothobranchius furzeri]
MLVPCGKCVSFICFFCHTESITMKPALEQFESNESCDSQETVILTESPSSKRLRLDPDAKHLVKSILTKKAGGELIINEYDRHKTLSDETRRKMVNILVADMIENNGTSPHRGVRDMYARGIVSLFPNLSDPFSRTGYEHFYDCDSGTGYLAWRIKTVQRSAARKRRSAFGASSVEAPCKDGLGGPATKRDAQFVPDTVLSEDECRKTIALIKYSADEDTIKKKMKLTFDFRRNIVLDPELSRSTVLSVFPRFKDVQGLVEQDFVLMFGEDASSRFLDKWTSMFKPKIIQQCRHLPSTSELENLLLAADPSEAATEVDYDIGWDSDLSSILLLLHLIPPSAQGRKRPGKVSASQAEKHLVVFKMGTNIQEHLDSITTSTQPYLLAVGRSRKEVYRFFIILDDNAIHCRSASSLGAFDELFKAHYVFGTAYNPMLHNMFTFIQTTVYNIDVGKVKESPRVAEVRARLLH